MIFDQALKKKKYSRLIRLNSVQYSKLENKNDSQKKKIKRSLSNKKEDQPNLAIHFPTFQFFTESVNKALERKRKILNPPKIQCLKINDRCKRILSLYSNKNQQQHNHSFFQIKKIVEPLISKKQIKILRIQKPLFQNIKRTKQNNPRNVKDSMISLKTNPIQYR